ncbi:hypothetical protein OAA19_01660 [Rubripirellula sp.]|nr:hypothetical protein [Rubripirellula sp.]MDB4338793.1 hypothetical protein [Rubripirellula sp.]
MKSKKQKSVRVLPTVDVGLVIRITRFYVQVAFFTTESFLLFLCVGHHATGRLELLTRFW